MQRAIALVLTVASLTVAALSAQESNWACYRGDAQRTAHTTASLPEQLSLHWSRRFQHAPGPAWPRLARMSFDRADHVAVLDGRIYVGSSVDGRLRCLTLESGRLEWSFCTEGPIRFAPCAGEGRVHVASDDGYLYTLDAKNGALLWKMRGGPDDRRVLGNGRVISRWPLRGGPVLDRGVLYVVAGIWPSEGIYVHALEAATGKRLWLNDDSGSLYMPQPHGGANAESGVSAQGHLVLTDELLLVPTGRAVPAAFDRETGEFRYYHLQKNGHRGGSATMASGKYFFNSGVFFDAKSGAAQGRTQATEIAGLPDGVVTVTAKQLGIYGWAEHPKTGARILELTTQAPRARAANSVAVAGKDVIIGEAGLISIHSVEDAKQRWAAEIPGTAHGLAIAEERLLVSSDDGILLCFGKARRMPPIARDERATVGVEVSESAQRVARQLLLTAKRSAGYALDFDCGDAELAGAVAEASDLHVVAIATSESDLKAARERLGRMRLLGDRVSVHLASSPQSLPSYFADLCYSSGELLGDAELPYDLARQQRPWGGVRICCGNGGEFERHERGALAGAGQWTHQYAEPGNSVCSNDEVRGPLGILWFRDLGQQMTQRHGRGPSPLFHEGRIYSLGLDELLCADAYNGRILWRYPFPGILRAYDGDHLMGTSGTHSPYCVGESGIYVRHGEHCTRLDAVTGKKLGRFAAPQRDGEASLPWGYIACDGERLYGSLADKGHVVTYRYVDRGGDVSQQLTESKRFFALDAKSGQLLWSYDAKESIRHNAIAIAGGRVCLIDRPVAEFDRKRGQKGTQKLGRLLVFAAATGAKLWERENEIFGTLLAASLQESVLLMAYQPTRFRLESETGGRLAAFDLRNGTRLWDRKASYASRPLLIGDRVYAQGGSWNLHSGEPIDFPFRRSYGCGILAGGKQLLVYRSATLGYWDLESGQGHEDFGGIRPGCWINALPAGGLVLVPDGTAGCACSYQNKSWVALEPDPVRPPMISPLGGAYRKPVRVKVEAADAGVTLRYTLDGSLPTAKDPVLRHSLRLSESSTLSVRAFRAGLPPSRVRRASFVIDPDLLELSNKEWRVHDFGHEKMSSAPSQWTVQGTEVVQKSNIFSGSAGKKAFTDSFYATLRVYAGGKAWRNGRFEAVLRNDDDDGMGLAFRYEGPDAHYLFHWDRQRKLRFLAVRDGDRYEILAKDRVPFRSGYDHRVVLKLAGKRLKIEIDGQLVFDVTDGTHKKGSVALTSWGSTGVHFKGLCWRD